MEKKQDHGLRRNQRTPGPGIESRPNTGPRPAEPSPRPLLIAQRKDQKFKFSSTKLHRVLQQVDFSQASPPTGPDPRPETGHLRSTGHLCPAHGCWSSLAEPLSTADLALLNHFEDQCSFLQPLLRPARLERLLVNEEDHTKNSATTTPPLCLSLDACQHLP